VVCGVPFAALLAISAPDAELFVKAAGHVAPLASLAALEDIP